MNAPLGWAVHWSSYKGDKFCRESEATNLELAVCMGSELVALAINSTHVPRKSSSILRFSLFYSCIMKMKLWKEFMTFCFRRIFDCFLASLMCPEMYFCGCFSLLYISAALIFWDIRLTWAQFSSLFLCSNSIVTGANYRVGTFKEIKLEGDNREM
jgi:hypothetical protein